MEVTPSGDERETSLAVIALFGVGPSQQETFDLRRHVSRQVIFGFHIVCIQLQLTPEIRCIRFEFPVTDVGEEYDLARAKHVGRYERNARPIDAQTQISLVQLT